LSLEKRVPPDPLFRIGRRPDPWQSPDWSRVGPDGTFGNRFDDPQSYYRVLYASSQPLSCYIETLARFRPDLTLIDELRQIEGDDDFFPAGHVPREWATKRLIGTATITGDYAAVCESEWIAFLRRRLTADCLRLGLEDLDASVLQSSAPRALTRLVSREAYELNFSGVYYLSRYGHDLENWAVFEPFPVTATHSKSITVSDPAFTEALRILGLKFGK